MCKFMSVIVVFAVFVASAFASIEEDLNKLDSKLTSSFEKCQNTSGVTAEHLTSLFSGETPLKGKAGCFIACIAKDMELIKANNMFDKDKICKLMEPFAVKAKEEKMEGPYNDAKKIFESCLTAQKGGDDACVAAKNVVECITIDMKKAGLFD